MSTETSKLDIVWVVSRGEVSETGSRRGSPIGVYEHRTGSLLRVIGADRRFSGQWKPCFNGFSDPAPWEWRNGSDYIRVDRWEVE